MSVVKHFAKRKRPEPGLPKGQSQHSGPMFHQPKTRIVAGLLIVGAGISQPHNQSDQAFFS